ncbi:MAG: hypothetical protein L6R48_16090, partial [Planctomycetes bacterium]|nr:hypothetical protein [Planctomycetota bacterium]
GVAAWLAVLCIAAGIAGRTAVVTVAEATAAALRSEARAMLGGDLEVAATRAPTAAEDAAIAAALPAGTRTTRVRALTTMATGTA